MKTGKRVQNVKLAVINGCVLGNRLLYQLGWGKCRGWTGHVLFVHESVLAPSAPEHAEPHQQCALATVTVCYRGGPSGQGLSRSLCIVCWPEVQWYGPQRFCSCGGLGLVELG